MKLHTLQIQAFGPFANTEEIDFNTLGDSPLFLIDGPTGAGKSTILHAICYALYGETTDEARKEVGLRCDHANDDTLTQLTLEFSIAKQHYKICRTPTQMRKQKRGDGFTEQKSAAHLLKILDDGTEQTLVAKKKKDADQQIVDIIGLSADQFRQVMVLPQGKFRELLLAKSDARQAIFSTLFQTEIYKYIEQILKDKSANIEREYKRFEERIVEALQEVNVLDVEQLTVAINAAKLQLAILTEKKTHSDSSKQVAIEQWQQAKKINDLFAQQQAKQLTQQQHLSDQRSINEKSVQLDSANKAKQIEHLFVALNQLRADKAAQQTQQQLVSNKQELAKKQLIDGEQLLQKAQQEHAARDSILVEIEQLKNYLSLQQELAAQQQQLSCAKANESQAKQALQQLQEQHQEFVERSLKGEKYVADLEVEIQQKPNLELQLNQQQQALYGLQQQHVTEQNLLKQQTQLQLLQQQQVTLHNAYLQAEQQANSLEMQWFSNQAAVLAQNLQPNTPCQVCGSSEHPFPANWDGEQVAVSKATVEQARAVQKEAHAVLNQHNSAVAQVEESIRITRQQLNDIVLQMTAYKGLVLADVEQQISQLNQQLQKINQLQQSVEPAKAKLQKMQAEIAPIAEKIVQLQQDIPKLSEALIVAHTSMQRFNKELPEAYRQQAAITQALASKQKQMTELEQKLQTAQTNKAKFENHLGSLSSQLVQLTASAAQLDQRVLQQEQDWQDNLSRNDFVTIAQFEQSLLAESQYQQLQQQIESYKERGGQLASQLQLLAEQLQDQVQPDLVALQQAVTIQQELFAQIEQQWADQHSQLNKLEDVAAKIAALEVEQGENKQQYQIVGTLAKAASGKGNVRVSLERFVLADLLDSVLSIASKRLHIMSKGQYQLVRQNEDLQKRNVTAGLDLAIDDAYTGKTRPVATLSGGESFLASLALALGLSDVVQQRSGGIQMDTLFIDEGFGSLDQESLQLAIQTLIDLQASGRTIGIISHVSELKEQMALRIDVQQSNTGSSIKTICDY